MFSRKIFNAIDLGKTGSVMMMRSAFAVVAALVATLFVAVITDCP